MGDYTEFQTTANANTASPPAGAPEGMAPSTVNDTMREMMAVIRLLGDKTNATLSTAIIDGTNNLTADQAKALIYRFTGALTADAGIIFPAGFVGWALVHNKTTGGFNLDCSVSGQAATIDNDEVALVISDGTDMVRFVGSEWDACCVIVKGPIRQEIPVDANIILGDVNTLASPTSGQGINNIAIGASAMGGAKVATQNVVIGPFAGSDMSGATGPNNNVLIGEAAGQNIRDGAGNTAAGQGAMRSQAGTPLTGGNNSAFGQGALASIEGSANDNSAFGQGALGALTTGTNNLALGKGAAAALTVGNNNVVSGLGAAGALIGGSNNVVIGENAGLTLVSGSGNIVIGQSADVVGGASANTLNIGNTVFGTGIGLGSPGNIGIGTQTPAFALDVNGKINAGGDIVTGFGAILDNAAGTPGQIHAANGFLYVCTAANTWQRVALSSF